MREVEARWFSEKLEKYLPDDISSCINIGSGATRPKFSYEYLFYPLQKRGCRVLHFDLKDGDEVDICGDIFDPDVQVKLKSYRPKVLICTNMVEHLPRDKLDDFARILGEILEDDGIIFVSAPYSFPYHADPIDTYYRPSPEELSDLFNTLKFSEGAIIESDRFFDDLRRYSARRWGRYIFRLLKPFRRLHKWKAAAHPLFWLFSRYKHSVVIFQKVT